MLLKDFGSQIKLGEVFFNGLRNIFDSINVVRIRNLSGRFHIDLNGEGEITLTTPHC